MFQGDNSLVIIASSAESYAEKKETTLDTIYVRSGTAEKNVVTIFRF